MTERAKKLLLLYYKQSRKIRRVSGLPPLTFKAKKAGTLKNYRIYGQTSRNLFDVSKAILVPNKTYSADGNIIDTQNSSYYDYFIPIDGNKTYTINAPHDALSRVHFFDANKNWISRSDLLSLIYASASTFTSPINSKYIIIQVANSYFDEIVTHNPEDLMLNSGSTALPYEPYGESVGDRTGNLFDVSNATRDVGHTYNESGVYITSNASNIITGFIAVDENTTYTIKNAGYPPYRVHYFDINKQWISRSEALYGAQLSLGMIVEFTTPNNSKYILMQEINSTRMSISTIMLNTGSTALPYEPYGYRVPVTVTNGTDTQTTNLYLPEQIKMVGDEAEYVDFKEQKQHFADGTSIDVTLPALPTLSGTNTLSVGTEVQPSDVEISGRIKAAGGD